MKRGRLPLCLCLLFLLLFLFPPPLSLLHISSSSPSLVAKRMFFLPQETQSTTFIANAKNKEIILNQISLRGSPTGCIGTKKPSPFYLDRFPASLEKQQVGWWNWLHCIMIMIIMIIMISIIIITINTFEQAISPGRYFGGRSRKN